MKFEQIETETVSKSESNHPTPNVNKMTPHS